MSSTMQPINHAKAGQLFSSVIRSSQYEGMYGYKELLKCANEGRFNGLAVSNSDGQAKSCILLFVDGEPDCVILFDQRGFFYGDGVGDLLQRVDRFDLFRVDEERIKGYIGNLGELAREQTAELIYANQQLQKEIQELRARETILRATEHMYREIVEHANSFIIKLDRHGHITFFNSGAQEIFGHLQGDVIGKHVVGTLFHESGETPGCMRERFANIIMCPEECETFQAEHVTGDTCPVWVSWTNRVLRDEKGDINGILLIGNDITDQKKTEGILRESEEKFRLLAEESPNMILVNREGRIVYANKKCEEIMGYSREELFAPEFNFFDLVLPEDRNISSCSFEMSQPGTDMDPVECTFVTKRGKRLEAILSGRMITFEGEQALLGVVTDITARKRAEWETTRSKRLYMAIFETTGTATMIVDQSGKVILANAEFERLFGYSKSEIENQKIWKGLFPEEEHERLRTYHYLRRLNPDAAPRNYETCLIDRNGDIREIHMTTAMIPNTTQSIISLTDITDQKQVENALRESERRYRLLAENAKDVIWTLNMYLQFSYISPSVTHLLDYSPDVCLNMPLEQVLTPKSYAYAHRIFTEELKAENDASSHRHGLRELEFECVRRDGSTVWVEARVTILRDEKGVPCGILGVARDISERKQIEHIKLEALEQIERNMEQFAILNDHIRNPLQAIVGLADLEGGAIADRIYQQAIEIDRIIKQLDVGWIESAKIREFLRKHYH